MALGKVGSARRTAAKAVGHPRGRRAEPASNGKTPPRQAHKGTRKNGSRSALATAQRPEVAKLLHRVALDLFAAKNYSHVTIKDISAASKVNAALIYYYYGSKEELFLQVIEETAEEAYQKFQSVAHHIDSPETLISMWIELHITEFPLMQKLGKISLDYATTHSRTKRIDEAVGKFYNIEATILRRAIRSGIAKGLFQEVNVNDAIVFISTFLDGCLFREFMLPGFDTKSAIRHMRQIILDHLRMPAARM